MMIWSDDTASSSYQNLLKKNSFKTVLISLRQKHCRPHHGWGCFKASCDGSSPSDRKSVSWCTSTVHSLRVGWWIHAGWLNLTTLAKVLPELPPLGLMDWDRWADQTRDLTKLSKTYGRHFIPGVVKR